jgi:hypothetical protein
MMMTIAPMIPLIIVGRGILFIGSAIWVGCTACVFSAVIAAGNRALVTMASTVTMVAGTMVAMVVSILYSCCSSGTQ